jgi:hypothetical protein
MNKPITIIIIFSAILSIGYYETNWLEANKVIFFIKKKPTLQITFGNLFASDCDLKPLDQLTERQRSQTIDFCKYYLDFETSLKNQGELDACKKAYYATRKNKPLSYINHESRDIEVE